MRRSTLLCLSFLQLAIAFDQDPWTTSNGNAVPDLPFSGITTFAHLPHVRCLDKPDQAFDVAIFGMPFDNAVSYRPGARFGPSAIRAGSRRQSTVRGYNVRMGVNPYLSGLQVMDCGDVPVTAYDSTLALKQMEDAYTSLLFRHVANASTMAGLSYIESSRSGRLHPRIGTLGGDHTIVLSVLRALNKAYGPVTVIHFDAHLDTWKPLNYPGAKTKQSEITHGTFFHAAWKEGLMSRDSNVHVGIRTRLTNMEDYEDDAKAGFSIIHTHDVEDRGVASIINDVRTRVGSNPVYVSLDIDVLDPAFAPSTGTPETGGFTTREVRRMLQGLAGMNIVGFDVVEVSPPYESSSELTALAAADIVFEFLSLLALPAKPNTKAVKDEL